VIIAATAEFNDPETSPLVADIIILDTPVANWVELDKPAIVKPQYHQPKPRKYTMSTSIVMTSKYLVQDTEAFKASLMAALGAESQIQTAVQKKLNELAVADDKSKMKGSEVSIQATIKAGSQDSKDEAIVLDVTATVSTLTINQVLSISLEVTTTETGKTENGVPYSVSNTQTYPLGNSKSTGILQIVTALNTEGFTAGITFDNQLLTAELKSDAEPEAPAG
jgi:hypothetical protein